MCLGDVEVKKVAGWEDPLARGALVPDGGRAKVPALSERGDAMHSRRSVVSMRRYVTCLKV